MESFIAQILSFLDHHLNQIKNLNTGIHANNQSGFEGLNDYFPLFSSLTEYKGRKSLYLEQKQTTS